MLLQQKTGISVSCQHVGILLQLKTGISFVPELNLAHFFSFSNPGNQDGVSEKLEFCGWGLPLFAPKLGFPVSSKTKNSCLARKLENHYSKRLPCSLMELRLRALLRKATSPLLPKTEIPCVNFSFRSPVRLKDWILMPAFR